MAKKSKSTPINPQTGFVSRPTAPSQPTRPGVPSGKGNVAFADGGKVKTTKAVDAKKK